MRGRDFNIKGGNIHCTGARIEGNIIIANDSKVELKGSNVFDCRGSGVLRISGSLVIENTIVDLRNNANITIQDNVIISNGAF